MDTLPAAVPVLTGISVLADRYDGFIFDLWGVLHDGEQALPGAVEALARLGAAGKRLCLLSNAPRRARPIAQALSEMGISDDHYHHLVTSGEAAHRALREPPDDWHAALGRRCLLIGPERDHHLIDDLPDGERVAAVEEAEFILNTGPVTYEHSLEDYQPLLAAAAARGLPMICANPDLEVLVGPQRVMCAGQLARRYRELGGTVRYHGKPHRPVYDVCLRLLGIADRRRILAIGDALATDVAGAAAAGIDAVLITGGIHCQELGTRWGEPPAPGPLARLLATSGPQPVAVLPCLRW
jgi:HAD superfamily hydrolase (TIGR01459 family)